MHPRVASALLCVVLLAGCGAPGPGDPEPFQRVTFLTVASFDGHQVPVTLYRPDAATAEAPVPAILHSHGWGGSRETRLEAFRDFTDAGFAVVAIDMRGHGEATGTSQARVANPAYEIRDVVAVVSHLANVSWIRSEATGDPIVGAMGESYGGAYPLLAAAQDPRLDAIVSRDTWNDLAEAMAPGGVPKTAWFASLWLAASIQGRIHPEVRAGFEAAIQGGRIPDGSGGEPDLVSLFHASSPSAYAGQVRVPSLFIQGVNDTLFDLGQAAANYGMVQATGAPVAMVTHLAGHTLSSGRPRDGRHPCGDPDDLALAWFKAHLQGGPAFSPQVCVALDDGATLRGETYPWPGPPLDVTVDELAVQPGNLTSRDAAQVLRAAVDTVILGAPRLSGTVAGGPANASVYWALEAVDAEGRPRLANGQVRPLRLAGGAFDIPLAHVAVHLREGETLRLAVLAYDPLFSASTKVAPQDVHFTGLRLSLPVACQACSSYST